MTIKAAQLNFKTYFFPLTNSELELLNSKSSNMAGKFLSLMAALNAQTQAGSQIYERTEACGLAGTIPVPATG
jgi:hypothetical protein